MYVYVFLWKEREAGFSVFVVGKRAGADALILLLFLVIRLHHHRHPRRQRGWGRGGAAGSRPTTSPASG